MSRAILLTAAMALMLATPAAAHDTGLDDLYTETGDDTHTSHHLRVRHWDKMIDLARAEMWHLRYQHARPTEKDPERSALRQELAGSSRRALEASREVFGVLQRQAKLYGCNPWPPASGNER